MRSDRRWPVAGRRRGHGPAPVRLHWAALPLRRCGFRPVLAGRRRSAGNWPARRRSGRRGASVLPGRRCGGCRPCIAPMLSGAARKRPPGCPIGCCAGPLIAFPRWAVTGRIRRGGDDGKAGVGAACSGCAVFRSDERGCQQTGSAAVWVGGPRSGAGLGRPRGEWFGGPRYNRGRVGRNGRPARGGRYRRGHGRGTADPRFSPPAPSPDHRSAGARSLAALYAGRRPLLPGPRQRDPADRTRSSGSATDLRARWTGSAAAPTDPWAGSRRSVTSGRAAVASPRSTAARVAARPGRQALGRRQPPGRRRRHRHGQPSPRRGHRPQPRRGPAQARPQAQHRRRSAAPGIHLHSRRRRHLPQSRSPPTGLSQLQPRGPHPGIREPPARVTEAPSMSVQFAESPIETDVVAMLTHGPPAPHTPSTISRRLQPDPADDPARRRLDIGGTGDAPAGGQTPASSQAQGSPEGELFGAVTGSCGQRGRWRRAGAPNLHRGR